MFSFTAIFSGCWSKVGRDGGAQPINLNRDCWNLGDDVARRNIKHEILHALGFHHEMNRLVRERIISLLNHEFFPDLTEILTFPSSRLDMTTNTQQKINVSGNSVTAVTTIHKSQN